MTAKAEQNFAVGTLIITIRGIHNIGFQIALNYLAAEAEHWPLKTRNKET